ncbi:MAG: DUF4062 domain-containing protein [Acidimicrobiales bacterium]|nr:DUF4062 domain-containing protein [Acidimicrobiales bacterium]
MLTDPGAVANQGQSRHTILTPDQRVRIFVSSTLEELAAERAAVCDAIRRLRLSPVLFELGARSHPPRSLYRSYLEQSHVFVGLYWERYGWVAPGMDVSGLEDEYRLGSTKPMLVYVKRPAPRREERLIGLLERIRSDDAVSYRAFTNAEELEALVSDDLSMLLSEAFLDRPDLGDTTPRRFTLPSDATPFIGRAHELDALTALVNDPSVRLVTLTGPGGIGKTRLALRAATQAAPAFEEGAVFVSLASVTDSRQVVQHIASAIGLRDTSGITLDVLKNDLSRRSLLLVVDNFEHVMAAAGILTELVDGATNLMVLVTSREALRVRAEHEFPVPPLDAEDSALMFEDRALAVRPDFMMAGPNREIVDRISQRLEGVPLAIELAAARVRVLTPAVILDRLDRRLDFLVAGPRDLPERQRALRDTIRWSFDLLDETERRVFSGLGVFVGSFSLSAVEAIAPALDVSSTDILDTLAALVDKSLVRAEASAGEPRFRMLQMVADFAGDRLAERAEETTVGELHAMHYHQLGLDVGRGVVHGDQRRWLAVVGDDTEGEAGNLRAALDWLMHHRRLDDLASLAWALWVPTWVNGQIEEGRRLAKAALAADGELSDRSRARLLVVLGVYEMWTGNHDDAIVSLHEGGELARGIGDEDAGAAAMLAESMVEGPGAGARRAEELALQTLETYRRLGDTWGEAATLNVLAWIYTANERFGDETIFEQALSVSLAAGDEQFTALAEVNLAEYWLHHGDLDETTRLLTSCIDRHRSLRLMYSIAYLLEGTARLAAHCGDTPRAARLLGAAWEIRSTTGVAIWGSQRERRDRFAAELSRSLGTEVFAAAVDSGRALDYASAVDEASIDLP